MEIVRSSFAQSGISLIAWCLMDNHVHPTVKYVQRLTGIGEWTTRNAAGRIKKPRLAPRHLTLGTVPELRWRSVTNLTSVPCIG